MLKKCRDGSSRTGLELEHTSRKNFGGLGLGLKVAWPGLVDRTVSVVYL